MEEPAYCEGGDLVPFFWVAGFEVIDYVVALGEGKVCGAVFFDGDLLQVFLEGFAFGFFEAFWCYSA